MFRKKIVTMMLLTLCFLTVGSVSALAAGYSFHFDPPFSETELGTSEPALADGNLTPYVDPSGVTVPTTYFLTTPDSAVNTVTDAKKYVSSAKTYLTYYPGYGGIGQSYRLRAYPSYFNFQSYDCAGVWQP